jgi:hypothetical protein
MDGWMDSQMTDGLSGDLLWKKMAVVPCNGARHVSLSLFDAFILRTVFFAYPRPTCGSSPFLSVLKAGHLN